MEQKIKVGDKVKIIKKTSDTSLDIDIDNGDIGVVNYVASNIKKCSVHIQEKKNTFDDMYPQLRECGQKYDYWIPIDCMELLDTKNDLNEKEDNKMKGIKNQKIVDLHFQRRQKEIEKEYETKILKVKKEDINQKFVDTLECQFNQYIDSMTTPCTFNVYIAETEETTKKVGELSGEKDKKLNDLKLLKDEVGAMLSGCETYEQEMKILHAYNIVHYNTNYVKMCENGIVNL